MSAELRLPARDAGLPAIHCALARGCPFRCPSWLPRGIARAWLVALTTGSQDSFAGLPVAIRCPRPSLQPQDYPAVDGGSMRWPWTWSGRDAGDASAAGIRRRAWVRSAERTGSNQMASRVPPTRGPRRGGPGRARRGRRVPRIGWTRVVGPRRRREAHGRWPGRCTRSR
jgi:hypothetical protein